MPADVILNGDKRCPKCHMCDIADRETILAIEDAGRIEQLEIFGCVCSPKFSIRFRDLVKGSTDISKTPNGTLYNNKTGELM